MSKVGVSLAIVLCAAALVNLDGINCHRTRQSTEPKQGFQLIEAGAQVDSKGIPCYSVEEEEDDEYYDEEEDDYPTPPDEDTWGPEYYARTGSKLRMVDDGKAGGWSKPKRVMFVHKKI